MKTGSDELVRLQKVLLGDSLKIPNGILEVLKSDIKCVLNSYFELYDGKIDTQIAIDDEGKYCVSIRAECNGIKKVKAI